MTWIPEAASNLASKVDGLLLVITFISIFFFVLISAVLIYFAVKYRRRSDDEETPYITGNQTLEIIWTVIPSILLILLFVYGFVVYKDMRTPPKDAVDITVTGKQWLWTFEYYNGKKTLNELYVRQNRPVRMVMRADDVIHSFFVPAFRVKQDLMPGRYTQLWFTPTKIGTFDIFCAEYCGTGHSKMLGKVIVLSPEAYDIWEKGVAVDGGEAVASLPPAELGEKLYKGKSCNACHSVDGSVVIGPSFKGLYEREGELEDGASYTADENYIMQSILEPQEQIVKGFQPVMPSFKGILSDAEITAIIAYIKTLK
ncbi:MAG: cytochrome c oxidase subunit II [Candidatus Dadabacteria bacterium]|nr:cytochrome c oxidase subunit II [Candidatus Dadabacteria bacterium]TDI89022.1 MAG: cytochrome c oxidase subunit II [Candidatus Dadabacteria bacterium]